MRWVATTAYEMGLYSKLSDSEALKEVRNRSFPQFCYKNAKPKPGEPAGLILKYHGQFEFGKGGGQIFLTLQEGHIMEESQIIKWREFFARTLGLTETNISPARDEIMFQQEDNMFMIGLNEDHFFQALQNLAHIKYFPMYLQNIDEERFAKIDKEYLKKEIKMLEAAMTNKSKKTINPHHLTERMAKDSKSAASASANTSSASVEATKKSGK